MRKRKQAKANVWIGVLVAIIVIVAGGYIWLNAGTSVLAEFDTGGVGIDAAGENAVLFAGVSEMGITNPVIDSTVERVVVRYNWEGTADRGVINYQIFALIGQGRNEGDAIIQVFQDNVPFEEWRVAVVDVDALSSNHLTVEEFDDRISISVLE
jgi:hypothetical protein